MRTVRDAHPDGDGSRSRVRLALGACLVLISCLTAGGAAARGAPPVDLTGDRASAGSTITAANVGRLRVAWRDRLPTANTFSGVVTSPPVVRDGVVYLQDMQSDVRAFDRATGRLRWTRHFGVEDGGPNGVAVVDGTVYGNTNTTAFALDAGSGRVRWMQHLAVPSRGQRINIAPTVAHGLVYISTSGTPPGGKGTIIALDARSGHVRWRFTTIRSAWAVPREAGGGGLWWPVSVDAQGRVYAGVSNPYPWGGSKAHPNGGAFRGDARYTDSLVVLDGRTGTLLWYDQVVPHDVRDYDFGMTPMLATLAGPDGPEAVVIGAGKGGKVVAWNRSTRRRLWVASVGLHRNDTGPLPRRRVEVCPGLLGGVVTPMAYAHGRVFVPVVDLCMRGSATGYEPFLSIDYSKGHGELVALDARTGRRIWRRSFASPVFGCATASNDLVFSSTYDGHIYALAQSDGRTVWTARARAGINACPTIDRDMLLLGAGADPFSLLATVRHELLAYRLAPR